MKNEPEKCPTRGHIREVARGSRKRAKEQIKKEKKEEEVKEEEKKPARRTALLSPSGGAIFVRVLTTARSLVFCGHPP